MAKYWSWNLITYVSCRVDRALFDLRKKTAIPFLTIFSLVNRLLGWPIASTLILRLSGCTMASWYVVVAVCCYWKGVATMYFSIGWPKCLKRAQNKSAVIRHIVSSCDRMFFAVITENSVTLWYSKVNLCGEVRYFSPMWIVNFVTECYSYHHKIKNWICLCV